MTFNVKGIVKHRNLDYSTEFIRLIGYRKEIKKVTFGALALCQSQSWYIGAHVS